MQRVFLRDTQEKTLESHNELFFDIDESLYNICLRLFATRWAINTKGTTVVVTHCPRFNYLGHYESWGPPSTVFQYLRSSLAAFLLFSVELNGIIGCVWQVEQTEWLSVAVAGIPDSILTNGAWQTEEDDGALRAPDCATRALRFSSKFWLGPQPKKLEKPERKTSGTFTIKKEARCHRYGDNKPGRNMDLQDLSGVLCCSKKPKLTEGKTGSRRKTSDSPNPNSCHWKSRHVAKLLQMVNK